MTCPGCGTAVEFRSERSPYAVCASCGHMLLRRELGVELLGRVGECQPDGTLLEIGTQGRYDQRSFTVAGRIQLANEDGFWNEWSVLYDDGEQGWLGEALGRYFVCFSQPSYKAPQLTRPPELGQSILLEGRQFVALDIKSVQIVSFEGELPFTAPIGESFRSIDFRSADGWGLTADYLSEPPAFYLGRWTEFSDLSLQGLRSQPSPGVAVDPAQVRSVACSSCGAPFELVAGAASRIVVCQHCGNRMDASHPDLVTLGEMVERASQLASSATLPLGTEAHLPEGLFRVVGFHEASTIAVGQTYTWTEYLLYNQAAGYRWLSQTDFHFTLFAGLTGVPLAYDGRPVEVPSRETLRYDGRTYKHFQTSTVSTGRVVGEFYWRFAADETSQSFDYISPPYLLSASLTNEDITWSLGRYLDRAELDAVFPSLSGVKTPWSLAANQPNPHQPARYMPTFLMATLACLIVVFSGVFLTGEKILWEKRGVPVTGSSLVIDTPVSPSQGNLRLDVEAPELNDRFVDLNASMTAPSIGQDRSAILSLASLESKGRKSGDLYFANIAAAPWQLRIVAHCGPPESPLPLLREAPNAPKTTPSTRFTLNFKLVQVGPSPGLGSLFLALLALAMVPISALILSNDFEKRRWAESDYG